MCPWLAEGSPVTVGGTFYFNTELTRVDWGDGTSPTFDISPIDGKRRLSLSKNYTNSGTYTITATIRDQINSLVNTSATVVVTDVAPAIRSAALAADTIPEAGTATLNLAWTDPGVDSHTVTVVATPQASGSLRTFPFPDLGLSTRNKSLSISGLTAGQYTLEVTVADAADPTKAAKTSLPSTVSAPQPPVSRTGSVQGSVSGCRPGLACRHVLARACRSVARRHHA